MTQRRGNGLLADTYVPLALLPSAVADAMLDALRREGIAGYAISLGGGTDEAGDRGAFPSGETVDATAVGPDEHPASDQLFVDANERTRAADLLFTEFPDVEELPVDSGERTGPDGATDTAEAPSTGHDAAWEDLVARFYETDHTTPGERAWPDAENVANPADHDGSAEDTGETASEADASDDDSHDAPDADSRVVRSAKAEPSSAEEEHYIPPPPPPIPSGDLVSRLAWSGLLGGPAVVLITSLLGGTPSWLAFLAVAGFIGGFVVLVVRMGDRPPRDSGPDDGAVV